MLWSVLSAWIRRVFRLSDEALPPTAESGHVASIPMADDRQDESLLSKTETRGLASTADRVGDEYETRASQDERSKLIGAGQPEQPVQTEQAEQIEEGEPHTDSVKHPYALGSRGIPEDPVDRVVPTLRDDSRQLGAEARRKLRRRLPSQEVVIGLDFGTSCTKVVLRTPYVADGMAAPLPANVVRKELTGYLIPSGIEITPDGRVLPGLKLGDGHSPARSLKLSVYLRPDDVEALSRAASFLSLVVRAARDWYVQTNRSVLRDRGINWTLHLGVPIPGNGDGEVTSGFLRLAKAAWVLSGSPEFCTLEEARRAIEAADTPRSDVTIEVLPEVIAEVVGYAKSQNAREGLHLLIDVGAFTVDICGFTLTRRPEPGYHLLISNVTTHGTHQLHQFCIETVGPNKCKDAYLTIDLFDPFVTFPGGIHHYSRHAGARLESLHSIEREQFSDPCLRAAMACILPLRQKRDPLSDHWRDGLPVFLCGGGAQSEWYRHLLSELSHRSQRTFPVAPFSRLALERPAAISDEQVDAELFQRLAVAYGLSFDRFDLGMIEGPDDIEDVPPRAIRQPEVYVSKDMT